MLKNLWWQQGPLLMAKSEDGDAGGSDEKDEKDEKDSGEESEESDEEESDESEEDDEESSDENDDDEELDEAAQKEAMNLYKLIKNPASQKQAIEILARSAGIELGGKPPENKKESEKVAKKTVEYLEEALGENLKWLAPKLASALDKMRDEDRAEFQKEFGSLKQSQTEKEVDQAYAELRRETKGESAKFENRMVGLADKLLPASGMSVAEYVRHLYTIASASGAGKSAKQRLAEKINKNSKDAPGRLRDSSSEGGGRKGSDSAPPMSALEAVTQTAKKLGIK